MATRRVAARHRSLLVTAAMGVFATTGAGCASFRGAPEPVFPVSEHTSTINALTVHGVSGCGAPLLNYYSPNANCRSGLDQLSYRNYVADVHIAAADAKYEEFRTSLSREIRGTAFGSSALVLLMNGIAIVSGAEAARALAAASAVTAGTYSSFSKEVTYEKTAQALVAAIEANRTTVKIRIRTGLQQGLDRYSLRDALDDVRDLESQASIEGAIQQLTTLATTDAAAKKDVLKTLYTADTLTRVEVDKIGPISAYLYKLGASNQAGDTQMLNDIAKKVGTEVGPTPLDTAANIRVWLLEAKQRQNLDAAIAKLNDVTKKESY